MSFLPLAILLIVDIFLIMFTVVGSIRERYKNRRHKEKRSSSKKAILAKGAGRLGNRQQYEEVDDGRNSGYMESEYEMESRVIVLPRRPTGCSQGGTQGDFMGKGQESRESHETDWHGGVQA